VKKPVLETKPVLIPLLNPNEPDAVLVGIHVTIGQWVEPGDLLCTLETTKSAADLEAESSGYVTGLQAQPGQSLHAGQIFCYLSDSPPEAGSASSDPAAQADAALPPGLRITQPALLLAQDLGIRLADLPLGPLITESTLRQIRQSALGDLNLLEPPPASFDPTAILVYGGGGHGKSLIDLLQKTGVYRIVGVIDDGLAAEGVTSVMDLPILGGAEALAGAYQDGVRLAVNAVGGIGNIDIRVQVFYRLAEAGFACPAIIHPSAEMEPSASLSPGVQVFAKAYIGSQVQAGYGAIVNTAAVISHECRLGNYANISPGAVLAGQVEIGPGALVGMGATINLQVKVGARARIGNGATVKADVPAGAIVRAGATFPD